MVSPALRYSVGAWDGTAEGRARCVSGDGERFLIARSGSRPFAGRGEGNERGQTGGHGPRPGLARARAFSPPTRVIPPSAAASRPWASRTPRRPAAAYRQMLLTTPGVAEFVSGVILFDETIRQRADDGTPLVEVLAARASSRASRSTGREAAGRRPGEQVTGGLDGLRERLAEYRSRRALRQVARGDHDRRGPSHGCIRRTPTRSPVTRRSARRRDWCRSSSPRC